MCPESQCAKNQRNGPCGGTRDGICEVYDSECIWSQAYERLKAYGEEDDMLNTPVVVKDNALARTSAWANALLGRDHQAWMMAEINKLVWGPPAPKSPLGKMDPAAYKQTADIALKFGVIKKPAGDGAYTHEIWELAQKK